jgi:hypothetical protein
MIKRVSYLLKLIMVHLEDKYCLSRHVHMTTVVIINDLRKLIYSAAKLFRRTGEDCCTAGF